MAALVKWFPAIPHDVVVIIAWFAIVLLIYPVWRSYDHELPIYWPPAGA